MVPGRARAAGAARLPAPAAPQPAGLETFQLAHVFEPGLQAELRRRRLDYLKLLAARLLLLAFIIFAFAQPVIQSRAVRAAGNAARLVVVDVSPSMACCGRLDRARRIAAELLGPEARLAALDSRLRLLERGELARLEPASAASSFSELVRALRAWQQEQMRPVEVHLVSDFQQSAFPAGLAGLQLPDSVVLRLHPVADRPEANWTVESVRAPARVRQPREARVQAVIAGFHAPEAQRTVVLRVAGRDVARKAVSVPPEGRTTVGFDSFDLPYGFVPCSVRLEPADALLADDEFLFAIERTDPLPLAFSGSRTAETYVRNALEAAAPGVFSLGGEAGWQKARALVAAGSLPPEAEVAAAVRRGMGLLLVLTPADAARGRVPVTGQKISGTRYAARSAEGYFLAQRTDPTSPLIGRAGGWTGVRFYQVTAVEPGEARLLASLEDGTPLLLEQPLGEGVVLILTFALDGVASDFPLQPSFVPFIEQAARLLTRWEDSTAVMAAGETCAPAAGAGARSFEVLDPRGRRVLSFAEARPRRRGGAGSDRFLARAAR